MEATNTREVPREEWAAFLAHVEAMQRDRPVQVELLGPELGNQTLAHDLRLRGISVTEKGSAAGSIELDLGKTDGGLDHRVLPPTHLYAIEASAGRIECLDIEDERHRKTLVRFKEPLSLPM